MTRAQVEAALAVLAGTRATPAFSQANVRTTCLWLGTMAHASVAWVSSAGRTPKGLASTARWN